jgi:hypothetical protein
MKSKRYKIMRDMRKRTKTVEYRREAVINEIKRVSGKSLASAENTLGTDAIGTNNFKVQ